MSTTSPPVQGLPPTQQHHTELQQKRESEEVKNEKFILPVERSILQEISVQLGHSREMADIWCPWENYETGILFIEEVTSIVDSFEKYKVTPYKDRTQKVLLFFPRDKAECFPA